MRHSRTLIVALGNPLRGDDRFGAMVLERLRGDPLVRRSAELLDAHTDLVGLVDTLAEYQRVILLDCVSGSGSEDGRILFFSEARFRHWARRSTDCHHLVPLEAIDLLRTLFPDSETRVELVALCVDHLTWTPRWSGPGAVAEAAEHVRNLLRPGPGAQPAEAGAAAGRADSGERAPCTQTGKGRASVQRPRRDGVAP